MPTPKKRTTKKKVAKKRKTTKRATTRKPARKTTMKKKTAKKAPAKKKTAKKATTRKKAARKAAPKKKAAKAKTKTKRKPNPQFMKPVQPSADLAAVVGGKAMPRTEVTKKLWDYIKKNKLQDATNRRMINADAKLKKVFGGKSKVNMFEMTKLVSKHLK